jgi:hypothetical protein
MPPTQPNLLVGSLYSIGSGGLRSVRVCVLQCLLHLRSTVYMRVRELLGVQLL